jgi:hypothetical protein
MSPTNRTQLSSDALSIRELFPYTCKNIVLKPVYLNDAADQYCADFIYSLRKYTTLDLFCK